MTEGRRLKFNQADKRKGKYPPLFDEMQKLAQEGHQVRHFEIVNEAGSHYKQGIPDEIGEATWIIKGEANDKRFASPATGRMGVLK